MGRQVVVAVGLAALVLASTGSVSGASRAARAGAEVVADLEGRSIKSELISSFYCHDFDHPRIHCYRSAIELERAVSDRLGLGPASGVAATAATIYVTIYDGPNFSGAYMHLTDSYDALFTIGWNDRVSSYIGRSSASGTFWTDWFATGTSRSFCCNVAVSSLPSGFNDAFSSVYRH